MILALIHEGNDTGAHEAARTLFPQASEEEICTVITDVQKDWNEFTDDPPVFEDDGDL